MKSINLRQKLIHFSKIDPTWRSLFFLFSGLILGSQIPRFFVPAPLFSDLIGRAHNLQSFEGAYFSSLRAYEYAVQRIIEAGKIPLVVLGDSTFRGTSAHYTNTWTKKLDTNLKLLNPRIEVLNLAQNAGDLVGPFLHAHLIRKYPEAFFILQQHFSSEVGARHQFHFWLSSEIAIVDRSNNPALNVSRAILGLSGEERKSMFLAFINICIPYLDFGNWLRFKAFGFVGTKNGIPTLKPLSEADDSEPNVETFISPALETIKYYRKLYGYRIDHVEQWMNRDFSQRVKYFSEVLPPEERAHTLLLSIDWNPFFLPEAPSRRALDHHLWNKMRTEMPKISDLHFISVSHWYRELREKHYSDLGHLNTQGQQRLTELITPTIFEFIQKGSVKN